MPNQFIKKLRGFGRLGEDDIGALVRATARPRRLPQKHDLIREGDRPGPVFVMLEGWAYRYKILPNGTRQVLAYLMPGDACDLHIGLLGEMDHSIQTLTDALVTTIGRDEIEKIFDDHPQIANAMYVSQLVDEGTMRAWITSMGRRTSVERVAHLMCELFIRARNIGLETDPVFDLPLSQLLLADSLGMTAVHLNRVLRDLRQENVMTLKRGCLSIIDIGKLTRIAGFDDNYLHRRIPRPPNVARTLSGIAV